MTPGNSSHHHASKPLELRQKLEGPLEQVIEVSGVLIPVSGLAGGSLRGLEAQSFFLWPRSGGGSIALGYGAVTMEAPSCFPG